MNNNPDFHVCYCWYGGLSGVWTRNNDDEINDEPLSRMMIQETILHCLMIDDDFNYNIMTNDFDTDDS